MVDALRCAHRMVTPDGGVVDLHPTASLARVDVDGHVTGVVDAGDAPSRHAAAGAAIQAAIDERLFSVERAVDFTFRTYGDTIEELREFIEANWRDARIDAATVDRTRQALRATPGSRVRVRESVRATRLTPRAFS